MTLVTYFILATISLLFGAVQAWVWPFYALGMILAFLLFYWRSGQAAGLRPGPGVGLGLAPFFAAALALCLPLPPALLQVVSPARRALLDQTAVLLDQPAGWAAASYLPQASLAWWGFLLSVALFYPVLTAHLAERRRLSLTLWLLFGLAVAQSLYGIVQALVPNLGALWIKYAGGMGNARGTWVNRNHFAGFLEMMLPLLLGHFLARLQVDGRVRLRTLLVEDRPHQHVLALLGFVIMVLALLFSKSRAGITGLGVGLFTFWLVTRRHGSRIPGWGAALMLAGALLVVFYGARMGFDPIIARFLAIDAENSRLDYWKDALAIVRDHPWGIGFASFKPLFMVYDTAVSSDTRTPYWLHNDVLQVLVDTGWVGFVSLMGGFVWFMARGFRRLRRLDPAAAPRRFFLAAGALSGLTAMAFHSFFDFNLQIPANLVYFVTLMAVAAVSLRPGDTEPQVSPPASDCVRVRE